MVKLLHRLLSKNINSSPLGSIEHAQFPILMAPFHGSPVPIMVRELTQAQIISCGDFSLIETTTDTIAKKKMQKRIDMSNIVAYAEQVHALVRKALVSPTYDEIVNAIDRGITASVKDQLDELEARIAELERGPKYTALQKDIDALRIWADFLLPEDFTSFIVSYALGVDKSDIKELSEEALIQAAVLAERGHNNPADHIDGRFTAFMKDDINKRAWILLHEKRDREKQTHGR